MTFTIRTASLLSSISCLLIALPALSAEPTQSTGTPTQSAPNATTPSTDASPATVPAQAAAAPLPNSAENATATAAPKATPEPQNSPTSVATSPYGPAAAPIGSSSPPKQLEPKDTYDGPPTLLRASGDYAIGGFGGFGVMYTRFAGKGAVQICGEGALIVDHKLTFGGGGCGITTSANAENFGPAPHYTNDRMHFGYGGAIIRYHLFTNRLVNLGIGALVGAGGLSIGTWDGSGQDWSQDYSHMRTEAVFVFEPQVGAYTNITRWLRMGANVGYRVVSGVDTQGLSASDLSAPTIGGVLQGGWF